MAQNITCWETPLSREGNLSDRPYFRFHWQIAGTQDMSVALLQLLAQSGLPESIELPDNLGTLYRQEVQLKEIGCYDEDSEVVGQGGLFDAIIEYGTRRIPTPWDYTIEFEVGTQTEKVMIANAAAGSPCYVDYGAADTPDSHGNIEQVGTGKDMKVNGTNILSPVQHFSIRRTIPTAILFSEAGDYYWNLLTQLVATVNAAPFMNMAAYSCMFLGCTGQPSAKNVDCHDMTFKFAAGRNMSNIYVGGILISKNAWDYVWVTPRPSIESADGKNSIVYSVKSVHVDKLYVPASWAILEPLYIPT